MNIKIKYGLNITLVPYDIRVFYSGMIGSNDAGNYFGSTIKSMYFC